jgi:hypothetical protein
MADFFSGLLGGSSSGGSLFSSSPSQNWNTTNISKADEVPPWLQEYTRDLFSNARAVAGAGYMGFPNDIPRISSWQDNPELTQAYNNVSENQGAWSPWLTAAKDTTTNANNVGGLGGFTAGIASADVNPFSASYSNVNQYLNPYTKNVVNDIADQGVRQLNEKLLPAISDSFVKAGQFGGSRMGEFGSRALRDTQDSILQQQNQALQQGYTQALNASNADQNRFATLANNMGNLGAMDAQNMLKQGSQLGELSKTYQDQLTKDNAALESVGNAKKAETQAGYDLAVKDFNEQRDYPQQMVNFMSVILRGLQPGSFSTTHNTSSAASGAGMESQPSGLQNLASTGSGLGSLYSLLSKLG